MPDFHHVPVLGADVVRILAPRPGMLMLDGTLGGGGHAELMLLEGAQVIGLDRDPQALDAARSRLSRFGALFRGVQANFRDAPRVLRELEVPGVDGALVDLGVSSPQLDDPARGFSFRSEGPLDMRMGPDAEPLSAFLDRTGEGELARVIKEYGEERFARQIAKAIKRALPIGDTVRLAEVVSSAIPRRTWPRGIHPATRTFQALRIAVNDELGALADWLAALPEILTSGGSRAAAISFHSLEDRAVKQAFAALAHPCRCPPGLPECRCGAAEWKVLTKKPVLADLEEADRNPRARSAKLRGVERL